MSRLRLLALEVLRSITPGQMIVKIVNDELIAILGNSVVELKITGHRETILVCGPARFGKNNICSETGKST